MEKEFREIDDKNKWQIVFHQLNQLESRNETGNIKLTTRDAKRIENRDLNRYRDVTPYDHSRIKLNRGSEDYINASLIEVESAGRKYILTQGPLPTTIGHFWLMIWEQKSRGILMLNGLYERGVVKCHQYWPNPDSNDSSELILGDVQLRVKLESQTEYEHFIIRRCLLTDLISGDARDVIQFHYTAWPDFGLPESPSSFLEFLNRVRESGSLDLDNYGPPVVHCSAGIGRSGTLCLVDSCLVLIEKYGSTSKVNVRKVLLEMRRYRMGLIQTPEQLRFSYMAIIDGAKSIRLGLLNENRSGDVTPIIDEDHISDSPKRTSLETCATTLPLDDSNLRFRRSQGSPPESTQVNQSIQSSSSVSSPSSESSSAATTTNNNSLSSGVEVRRRQREERNKKMEETIRNIKEKQKKIEDRLTPTRKDKKNRKRKHDE